MRATIWRGLSVSCTRAHEWPPSGRATRMATAPRPSIVVSAAKMDALPFAAESSGTLRSMSRRVRIGCRPRRP